MTRKKIVLIPGNSLGDNSFGANKDNLNYISQFGIPRILMPNEEEVVEADMLYLPGGLDINPANYGQVPGFYTSNSDVYKEYFYRVMLPKYIKSGINIVGICLGMQQINTIMGGTLTQHLPYHPESQAHGMKAHRALEIIDYTESEMILKSRKTKEGKEIGGFSVNSHHHQGVLIENLSKEFVPLYASEDEVIEIIAHKEKPILGFQMHPERYYMREVDMMIEMLLETNSTSEILKNFKREGVTM